MQISNAYLQFLRGPDTKMLFEFVKEMPKHETPKKVDVASVIGGLLYTWVVLQLFPVSAKISEQIYLQELSCVARDVTRNESVVLTLYCSIGS